MALLAMSQRYRRPPSELLHIDDEYTAYCLDEACAYIMTKMDNGEEPVFKQKYSSFSELYKNYE